MLFPHLVDFTDLANRWDQSAKGLAEYDHANPTAKALERNARELRDLIVAAQAGDTLVTIREFARMHGVSSQSVRNWIRAGELEAVKGQGRAYFIRRNAVRKVN